MDKFCMHIRPSLQDIDKLYDRLIPYLIFEIHFNIRCYYLKMYLEDFFEILAILKESYLNFFLRATAAETSDHNIVAYELVKLWKLFCPN